MSGISTGTSTVRMMPLMIDIKTTSFPAALYMDGSAVSMLVAPAMAIDPQLPIHFDTNGINKIELISRNKFESNATTPRVLL